MAAATTALDADWLAACRRAAESLQRCSTTSRPPRARGRDGHARQRRRPDAGDRRGRRGARVRRARRLHRRGLPVPRDLRGARRGRLRRRCRPRGHRPDRRLAERQAQAAALRAVDRRRRRTDDGRRRVRLRPRLRRRRGVVGEARRGRLARRRTARSRRSASGGPATAGSSCSAVESADPRWVAGPIDGLAERAHRLRALGTIAPALCQVAAARFDGLVSLRDCRAVDAAAGQLIVREAGGYVELPAIRGPARRAARRRSHARRWSRRARPRRSPTLAGIERP